MHLNIEKGLSWKLINFAESMLNLLQAFRSLPLFATIIIFSTIGILISSIQYDISYFAEQVSALAAISTAIYALNAVIKGHSVPRIIIGGCFVVATWAYFMPIFSGWSISILNDLAIIVFCTIGVFFNGSMQKQK